MKIILAGHNVDVESLREITERLEIISREFDTFSLTNLSEAELRHLVNRAGKAAFDLLIKDNLTPETLSAAYARISRRPQPVPEIRRAAREGVSRARRSNLEIVFEMGHKSVAEHAVYNFDVLDISRLATEFVQGNRLCSFTEKSQRYVRFQENVYIPPELADSPLYDKYWDVVHRQFQLYRELTDAIHRKLSQEPPESVNNKRSGYLENLAGEDARYILPLATYTQFGMTLNARALEWMVMKANAHPLPEIQEFARELSRAARQLTPSLIRYTEPTDDYKETPERIRKYIAAADSRSMNGGEERVRLLTYPEGGDDRLLATLLYSTSSTPWDACRRTIDSFDPNRKQLLFRDAMKGVGVHDPVWREFETLDFDFEVILSASAYAQLKRHRMSTQFMQGYDLALGVVVPTSVKDVNMERDFMDVINGAELLYKDIAEKNPTWADYVLTNAHCRRVLLHVNARELYHMARLRMDSGAQWEIRGIVEEIIQRVTEVCPLTFSLASGKDTFAHHYARLFADNGNIQSDL